MTLKPGWAPDETNCLKTTPNKQTSWGGEEGGGVETDPAWGKPTVSCSALSTLGGRKIRSSKSSQLYRI